MANILGIDPGTRETGWIVWDTVNKCVVPAPTTYTLLKGDSKGKSREKLMGKDDNEECLRIFTKLAKKGDIDDAAIEMMTSYGKRVGNSVFRTCVWIGKFEQALSPKFETYEVFRKRDVCVWICRDTHAKDKDVRQALIDRYGAPGTKKNPGILYGVANDVWSALAIALTYDEKYRNGKRKKFK
jgi:hypothetical protein